MGKKNFNVVLILLGVLILASIVYLYMLIKEAGDRWPAYREPGTLTQRLETLDGEVRQLQQQVAQIPARREVLEKLKVEYKLASRVLPRESSPDQLLAAIRTKAQQAGVFPNRLTPSVVAAAAARPSGQRGAAPAGGAFEIWRFSLSLEGNYDQIATFVNKMEEFDSPDAARTGSEKRFFEVKEFSIVAQDSGLANLGPQAADLPVQHKCNLTMQTYRYTGQ